MKFNYLFLILLFLFLCGNAYASEVNLTDANSDLVSLEEPIVNDTDSNDEILKADAKVDIYFDASASNDRGDGSLTNPYKNLNSARMKENSIIHLAKGEYNIKSSSWYSYVELSNVSIVGENRDNTIISSTSQLYLYGESFISGVTLKNIECAAEDLTISNVKATSLVSQGGNFFIQNSEFRNGIVNPSGDENSFGGAIRCIEESSISLYNCLFINNGAEFGGAIYMDKGYLNIDNCSFINNTAFNYGGAIACENVPLSIYNSVFKDNSALSDAGGSIYMMKSNATLEKIDFYNSTALFGGAITSLSSDLNVSNSNFEKNHATYMGGAIYLMYGKLDAVDSKFNNNSALSGGALFVDNTDYFNVKSTFNNNSALLYGGAIYSFKNKATFENSYTGNTAASGNDLYENDKINLTITDEGNYPLFKWNPTTYDVLPSKYNLNDYGYLSTVKNQLDEGNCWAFTAMAVLESCILKASNTTYDFSEENMKNIMAFYSDYGYYFLTNSGGTMDLAVGYLTSWFGPVNESDDKYANKGVLSPYLKSIYHVQNVVFLKRDSYTDNDMIKDAILKYGAVGTTMYYDDDYYKTRKNAYYFDGNQDYGNHAVTIVGWDDAFSKNNFIRAPEADGAWIVRNSWGDGWGKDGYFYVSYYDKLLAPISSESAYTFLLNDSIKLDKNYQYEQNRYSWWAPDSNSKTITYYNIYTMESKEYLAAASTYFYEYCDYKLEIFVNDTLKSEISGKAKAGYYTIQLEDYVEVNKNDNLKVSFTISNASVKAYFPYSKNNVVNNVFMPSKSFFIFRGRPYDLCSQYDNVACIKAFTYLNEIQTNIKLIVNNSQLIAQVVDYYGNILNKGVVAFKINDKTELIAINNSLAILDYDFSHYDFYNITASWQDTGYESCMNNTSLETEWDVKLNVYNCTYGDDLVVNIQLGDGKHLNDNVTLKIGSHSYNILVNQSNMTYIVPDDIDAGLYNVSIEYDTLNNYHKHSYASDIKIDEYDIILLDNGEFTYQKGTISGYFEVGGLTLKSKYITFNNYIATLEGQNNDHIIINGSRIYFKNLEGRKNYNLTVTLNETNCRANQTFNIHIKPAKTSLIIPNITLNYGESLSINAITDADEIKLVDDKFSDHVSYDGKKITVGGFDSGVYYVNFQTADNNYENTSANVKITVNKIDSYLSEIKNFDFDYGTPYNLNVDYEDALNVTAFVINHNEAKIKVADGVISISHLDSGNYSLNISTIVDSNHNSVSKTVNFTVNKRNVNLYVSNTGDYNMDNVYYGSGKCTPLLQVYTHDVVNWDYMGGIPVFDRLSDVIVTFNGSSENVIMNDDGSFYLKNLTVGTYQLHVELNDSNRKGNSNFNIKIQKGIASLDIPEITIVWGQSGNIMANTIAESIELGEVSEYVQYISNKDQYQNHIKVEGRLITVLPGLDVGHHEIYFIIKDPNWESSKTAVLKVNVIKANSSFSTVDKVQVHYGVDNISIDGAVEGIDEGTVRAMINNNSYANSSIANGIFNITIPIIGLNAGDYTIVLSSNDSSKNYNAPNNAMINLKIGKADCKINASVSDVKEDEKSIVIVDMPSNAKGIVNVEFDNETYFIDLSKENRIILPIKAVGNYNVTISYTDLNYNPSSITKSFSVSKYNAMDLNALLSEAINNGCVAINLTRDYEFNEDEHVMINMTHSITINGNGHIITFLRNTEFNASDKDHQSMDTNYLFNIQDGAIVEMNNLTLDSVGITVKTGSSLSINHFTIKNAECAIDSNGSLKVNNTAFTGNYRAIDSNSGSLTVMDSIFSDNHADSYRNIHVADDVEINVCGNMFDAEVDISPKEGVAYSQTMIINGTFDSGVNFKIPINLTINHIQYNVTVNDAHFRYENNQFDAGNYTAYLADNDAYQNAYVLTNHSKNFTIDKLNVDLLIYSARLNQEISEVTYGYGWCNEYVNVVSKTLQTNATGNDAETTIWIWKHLIALFDGSSDNCKMENGKLYLKNLTAEHNYTLNVVLNESNYAGSITTQIKINKGITSLNIPNLNMDYGEGGIVTITSDGETVEFYERVPDSSSNNQFSEYVTIDGGNIIISSLLPAGNYNFSFIVKDENWKSAIPSNFNVTVKKATVEIIEINGVEIVYGNDDEIFVTGKINALENANNYTGLLNVSLINGGVVYRNNNSVNVFRDGEFCVGINVKGLGVGYYAIHVEGAETADYNKVTMMKNITTYINISKANVAINDITVDSVVYGNDNVMISGSIAGIKDNYAGTIIFTIEGTQYCASLDKISSNGSFKVNVDLTKMGLAVGSYDVSVNVVGDGNYSQVNRTFAKKLNIACANVTVDNVAVEEIVYGNDVAVKVNGNVTSNIKFGAEYDGNVTIAIEGNLLTVPVKEGSFSGTVSLRSALNQGSYAVEVNVIGNENYSSVKKEFNNSLIVKAAGIDINDIGVGGVTYGDAYVIVDGTITNRINSSYGVNYTGLVKVYVDGQSINNESVNVYENGSFSVRLNFDEDSLNAGNYDIVVKVNDDGQNDNYVGANRIFENALVVYKRTVDFVEVNGASVIYGNDDTVYITGKVNNTVNGDNYTGLLNVSLIKGGVVYRNNNSVNVSRDGVFCVGINVKGLGVGYYAIHVEGAETDNYNKVIVMKNINACINILKADVVINDIAVDSVVYGNDNVMISGSIAGIKDNYAGTIIFTIEGTQYCASLDKISSNGSFKVNVDLTKMGLAVGSYDVSVNVVGDGNYSQVNRTFAKKLNIACANVTVDNVAVEEIVYGNDVAVKVNGNVTSNIKFGAEYDGNVTIAIEGNLLTVPVKEGSFSGTVSLRSALNQGSYAVEVNVIGNENYSSVKKEFNNSLIVKAAGIDINDIGVGGVTYGDAYVIVDGTITNRINSSYGVNYTGLVKVYVDGQSINNESVNVYEDGSFSVRLNFDEDSLNAGNYDIVVKVNDDGQNDNYVGANRIFENALVVYKRTVDFVEVNGASVIYGNDDAVYITGKVNNTVNGDNYTGLLNVSLIKGGVVYRNNNSVNVSRDGEFCVGINVKNLVAGEYAILIEGDETFNYNELSEDSSAQLIVKRANVLIGDDIHVNDVGYGNEGIITVTGSIRNLINSDYAVNYTGVVEVNVNGSQVLCNYSTVDTDGTFKVTLNIHHVLNANRYTLNVIVKGNDNYTCINKEFINNLTITPANVSIKDIVVEPIAYGEDNSISVSGKFISNIVFGQNYTGDVSVSIIGTNISKTATVNNDGSFNASLMLGQPYLDAGTYSIGVTVKGNNDYNGVKREFKDCLTVLKANRFIDSVEDIFMIYGENDVVNVSGKLQTIQYGEDYAGEITVMITNRYTNEKITGKGKALNGSFNIPIEGIKYWGSGEHIISITGEETRNYNSIVEYNNSTLNILKSQFEISIAGGLMKINHNISVLISGIPTGNFNVSEGKIVVDVAGIGNYTIEVNDSQSNYNIIMPMINKLGDYEVTAQYIGNNNYNPSNIASKVFTVTKWNATDLQNQINDAIINNQSELNLTQDYEFESAGKLPIVINKPILINGNGHMIDANGSSGIFNITSDNVMLKNMTLTGSNDSAIEICGSNADIENICFIKNNADRGAGVLSNGNNTSIKNSTFINNSANAGAAILCNGEFINISHSKFINNVAINDNGIALGKNNVVICLDEFSRNNGAKLPISFTVGSIDVTGFDVQINISASGQGTVYIELNGEKFSSEVVNGTASIKARNIVPNSYDINVTYSFENHVEARRIISFTIDKKGSIISAPKLNAVFKKAAIYTVTFNPEVSGKTLVFYLNNKKIGLSKTNNKGIASIKLTKTVLNKIGTKTLRVEFDGDEYYNACGGYAKIVIKKSSKIKGIKKTYKFKKSRKAKNIKLTLKSGKLPIKRVKVTLKLTGKKIKGKKIITLKTNRKGKVIFKLAKKLTKKTKIKYKLTYNGSKSYYKVSKTGKIIVKG